MITKKRMKEIAEGLPNAKKVQLLIGSDDSSWTMENVSNLRQACQGLYTGTSRYFVHLLDSIEDQVKGQQAFGDVPKGVAI